MRWGKQITVIFSNVSASHQSEDRKLVAWHSKPDRNASETRLRWLNLRTLSSHTCRPSCEIMTYTIIYILYYYIYLYNQYNYSICEQTTPMTFPPLCIHNPQPTQICHPNWPKSPTSGRTHQINASASEPSLHPGGFLVSTDLKTLVNRGTQRPRHRCYPWGYDLTLVALLKALLNHVPKIPSTPAIDRDDKGFRSFIDETCKETQPMCGITL